MATNRFCWGLVQKSSSLATGSAFWIENSGHDSVVTFLIRNEFHC